VLAPDLNTARRFINALEVHAASLATAGRPAVIIAPSDLRRPLYDFATRFVADLFVITARELVPGTQVEPAGTIDLSPTPWSQAA
jgi:flagellar biosynthesis protein FlhA